MTRPRLHVVALSHLDTQWRWTARDTVREHLPRTVEANEALFARFPRYVLSFEGAWRYRLLAEHHPRLFARVRARVRDGRWFPAGAALEAFDTLLPAPESILRQILYGTRWFERELGIAGRDLLLPDCFGFPAILPTLAVHAGIVGFSTQKLRRGELMRSAFGVPFAYGRWRGPDGSELPSALDPGEYAGRLASDPARDPEWKARFAAQGERGGERRMLYVGSEGDRGGAADETTLATLETALEGGGAVEVRHGPSERIFLETGDEERARLPAYEGELLLHLHGTGCYTAKAAMKRWNRIAERTARAAEAAWALARLEGARPPLGRFERAWSALLAHQMHDDLTGTSIPAAYRISFDDLGWAVNELEELLADGASAAAATLDRTAGQGDVHLALSTVGGERRDLVELALDDGLAPASAIGADGEPLAAQVVERPGEPRRALVPVATAGVELVAIRLLAARPPAGAGAPPLEATPDRLENDRYRATFDDGGRLVSLFDKRLDRELLAAPLELELLPNRSRKYPAWEIRWQDLSAAPRGRVERLVRREVVERGPLRAALAIDREARECRVRETWTLAAAEHGGDLLCCEVELDWHARGRLLAARFPLAARAERAWYDTGLGAIARPVASEKLHEVPAQQWAAIEDADGGFAVAILADCRHGWNQPDPGTLRSTWIHAPSASLKFRHQASQDFGRHRFRYALGGFAAGAVGDGSLAARADRFALPPVALRAAAGGVAGGGARRRLLAVSPPGRLLAIKPAEAGEGIVARIANAAHEPATLEIEPTEGIASSVDVDALERACSIDGERPVGPSGLRSIELQPHRPPAPPADDAFLHLPLPWTVRGFSRNGEPLGPGFDGRGRGFPLELVPRRLDDTVVPFDLTHLELPTQVALADGQGLELRDPFEELWLLLASVDRDRTVELTVGERPVAIVAPAWRRPFLLESRWRRTPFGHHFDTGRVRRVPVAFAASHLHDRRGRDRPVERVSLFAVCVPLAGERRVTLPRARRVRLVAATLARRPARPVRSAAPPLLP